MLELVEDVVFDRAVEREPVGQLDAVFEELDEPVIVFEDVVVRVEVVVDVIVLDTSVEIVV